MTRIKNWDAMYKTRAYQRCWNYKTHSPELAAVVASGLVPEKARVLDVGCGTGSDALFLSAMGYATTAIDISPEALNIAAKRSAALGLTVDWRVGDVLEIPLEDSQFDFVCDRGCFHHILESNRPRYANEISRVLHPQGVLFLVGSCKSHMFVPVDERAVKQTFDRQFEHSRLVPLTMVSDNVELEANMVILRKRGATH